MINSAVRDGAALGEASVNTVLVVDDSRAQRMIVSSTLKRQGFTVVEAGSGEEALEKIATEDIDLILSDWMMPGMDGLELCQAFRAMERDKYGYFILLTSKSEKGAVAQGLDVGADDFLNKPVNAEELRARINAGGRIMSMERELQEKNRLVNATLTEIQTIYDSIDRDLIEARNMQQSLVRERFRDFGSSEISLLLQPCGHVGGDLVGMFQADENTVAIYSIDVSGHGIASALLTARLASYLSDGSPEQNITMSTGLRGKLRLRDPEEVAYLLNTMMLEDMPTEHYFTMILAYLDLNTGVLKLTQCGHPNPVLLRADGSVEYVGQGGLPIGLIRGSSYERFEIALEPGDRLMFYSDGFTEAENEKDQMLEEEGFERMISRNASLKGQLFLDGLVWELDNYCGSREFGDDLSMAVIEYKGQTR
ncbi:MULTISPECIES: PP2C family protein-serine/threonine phosphatase [unclassified Aliiroseovarius]|uniref:PP2C family protein-serine/threonine phosphatase n=1 Tax=unclassified Aliiroseovarius TaxID=2623558 RepID=UPI0015680EE9|nr:MULTISPECIES: SpoIIE family protein phosphatase [unclassified Aliiroseovarius]NRP13409.1 Alkaline phosphatase synthesis transcriptional regulatory protein PhoP [Aliiroseovarius sp. xm-d-517]NRP40116.1 Alkaline phosphatase synthesis transcriptional regulatory protein PhoP [Aliiroseovarius sp. xm-m-339-2]NRP61122.1 Alkaline phosphatase synthesis transcriptional regulatory protein PhoP [Aliiroseovarius sp. xm-a-151]